MTSEGDTLPTVRAGLIGSDIRLSKSPSLHLTDGRAPGPGDRYAPFDTLRPPFDAMTRPDRLAQADGQGFAGVDITHPFKQAVPPHPTGLSDDAAMRGAVDTVVVRDGARTGHDTDRPGSLESLRGGLPGAALAHAALTLGIGQFFVFDRDAARAATLAEPLGARFGAGRARAVGDVGKALAVADGLTEATPTGPPAHPGLPIAPRWLRSGRWVGDIVSMPLVAERLVRRAAGLPDAARRRHDRPSGARRLRALLRPHARRRPHDPPFRGPLPRRLTPAAS